jgi:hypothetical protein
MDAYHIPPGFFVYNLVFGLVFLITAMLVSLFSYRVYKLTKQDQLKLFSLAFLGFSLAYITRLVTDVTSFFRLNLILTEGMNRHELREIMFSNVLSDYAFMLFFIGGLILLTYMTFKTKNRPMLFLLFGTVVISLLLNPLPLFLFHVLASLFFIIIVIHYYKNYKLKRKSQAFLVFLAFVFLFLGNLTLIFSTRNPAPFTLGRILELVAYFFILTDLILIYKKKK